MDKQKVLMKNWEIDFLLNDYANEYNLNGVAEDHPKLGKNVFVAYTSQLKNAFIKDDTLYYETKNTLYVCPLKYIDRKKLLSKYSKEELLSILNKLEEVSSDIDFVIKAQVEIALYNNHIEDFVLSDFSKKVYEIALMGEKDLIEDEVRERDRLLNIVSNPNFLNSVYIEVSKIAYGDTLAFNINGELGIIKPSQHTGMFQDSILYSNYKEPRFDIRYFPYGDSFSFYAWSKNIEKVILKNEKKYPIYVGTGNSYEILPNETITIKREDYFKN